MNKPCLVRKQTFKGTLSSKWDRCDSENGCRQTAPNEIGAIGTNCTLIQAFSKGQFYQKVFI